MKKSVSIIAAVLFAGTIGSQANLTYLLQIGFEFSEGNSPENGQAYWQGDGTPTHGIWIEEPGGGDRTGNFSIPSDSTRFLVDDGNSRSGSQSARLSESAPGDYRWINMTDPGLRTEIENSLLPIRLGYSNYRAQTGDDLRSNGMHESNPNPTLEVELWQMRVAGDGNISIETGGGTFSSNPGNLVGWYDFEMDVDFNTSQILAARFQEPGASGFTELITGGPVDFKGSVAATTFQVWKFRPDNGGVSPDTAWDDIFVAQIPEPGALALLALGGLLLARTRRK